ncbi:hypothetical protein X729_10155 [Mesorhizobium sp. L103C131B0]|nr:hypothetical protein X729_10155 [Mesorhizobium sp. L103C131B0]
MLVQIAEGANCSGGMMRSLMDAGETIDQVQLPVMVKPPSAGIK